MRNILIIFALLLTLGMFTVQAQESTPTPVPTYCFENGWCTELPTLAPTFDPWATYEPPEPTDVPTPQPTYTPKPEYPYPAPPYPAPVLQQGSGNCGPSDHKVETSPFKWTAPEGQVITKVVIKSGQGCFTFTSNGTDGCYWVTGIGTQSAKASRVGNPSSDCQEISHVEFSAQSTPPTSTSTVATPFKFWTFTPSPTVPEGTPTSTPTLPVETSTPTLPGETRTPEAPTDTPTQPPERTKVPPERRTSTPEVALPQAGEAPLNSGGAWIGPLLFGAALLAYLVITAILRLSRRDEYEITRELTETRDKLRDQIWGDDD